MKTPVEEEAGLRVKHVAFVTINSLVHLHPSGSI